MCVCCLFCFGENATVTSVICEQACRRVTASPGATRGVLAGHLVPVGTALVTPVVEVKGQPEFNKPKFVRLKALTTHMTWKNSDLITLTVALLVY